MLALIVNALAIVRFRFPESSHFSRELPNLLFVTPLDHDVGRIGTSDVQCFRNFLMQLVGIPDSSLQYITANRRQIPDTFHLKPLLVAFGDALYHIGDESPGQSMTLS